MVRSSPVRVVTAAEAGARDRDAIDAGIPSRALMQRAGAAAAAEIALRLPERLAAGAAVYVGPGNNGGDGWVVARALAAAGLRVTVIEPVVARTPDCLAERELALASVQRASMDDPSPPAGVVVDALLGTGASGAPRDRIADAIGAVASAGERGAAIVAIDLPSGIDADGNVAEPHLRADLTLTFGTLKRAHLLARPACGRIAVLDIGLGRFAERADDAPSIVDERWVAGQVPPIAPDAHKGTRGRVVVVGGAPGMAGAVVLAVRAALHSGAGMVRALVHPDTVETIVRAEPAALVGVWPEDDAALERDVVRWAHALAIGPGLGATVQTRTLTERLLRAHRGPVLLDADALNVFAHEIDALAPLLADRPALLTPHQVELARLLGVDADAVGAHRFEMARDAAARARCAVLLKGVPTIVGAPDGSRLVSASGTPILATGGSGDLLTGMAVTLLAQMRDAPAAAACAAWVHGRASELAGRAAAAASARGVALEEVIAQLPLAWRLDAAPARYPVLLELAPVG